MNEDHIKDWLEAGKGGYTLAQLSDTFDDVKNPEHWKMDIDTVVDAKLRDILGYAIPWFVGSGQITITDIDDETIRVQATGYWSNGMDG